jgi:hypothetical protein
MSMTSGGIADADVRTILLTGGRAPATLDLARCLARAGYRIVAAESLHWPMSRWSRSVSACYRVPPPRADARAFVAALHAIVRRECIDLIIPTCEEVFHLARHVDVLDGQARVFAPPFAQLARLHSKCTFIEAAAAAGLPAPETRRVTTWQDMAEMVAGAPGRLVVKPEFTRFGSEVILRPDHPTRLANLDVRPDRPWVVQQWIDGRQACTYAVAHAGALRAYAAYGVRYTAGPSSTIYFEPDDDPALLAWVRRFVEADRVTGQMAFDFVVTSDGVAHAVECNPRATSGVHLLADEPGFADTFVHAHGPLVFGRPRRPRMLALPMCVYGARPSAHAGRFGTFVRDLWRGRDVVARLDDPWPAICQPLTLFELVARSRDLGCNLLSASTADIAWNGEP